MRVFNVLHVVNGLRIGGTEKQLFSYLKYLNRERFNSTVFCITDAPLLNYNKNFEFDIIIGNFKKFHPLIFKNFADIIRKNKIDIIHSYLFHSNILSRCMGKVLQAPIVINEERGLEGWKKSWHVLLDKSTSRFADLIIANSKSVKENLITKIGITAERVMVVNTGIDFEEFEGLHVLQLNKKDFGFKENDIVVGSISRLQKIQGIAYLIEAAKIVSQKIPNIKFLIVGDGPEYDKLRTMEKMLALDNRIKFLGLRMDIRKILYLIDIFVRPSLEEGLPRGVMEAMASNKPFIASHVGGNIELADHGRNGILVPPKDSQALSDAILCLAKNPDLRAEMGRKGRKYLKQNFDWRYLALRRQEIYERLIKLKGLN